MSSSVVTYSYNLSRLPTDDAVPGRERLLDQHYARNLISELMCNALGYRVSDVVIKRVKYRIGESLRVTYRVTIDGPGGQATQLVTARTFADGGVAAFAKAQRCIIEVPILRPVLHHPQTSSVWWSLPNDRRLLNVDQFLSPSPRVLTTLGLPTASSLEVVEYAAERSLTLCVRSEPGLVLGYLKHYAPGTVDIALLSRRYRRVAAGLAEAANGVRSPEILATDEDSLVLEPMPGVPWAGVSSQAPATLPNAFELLGRAIGTLHSLPLEGSEHRFERLDDSRIERSAEIVGSVRPDLAGRFAVLAASLVASRPPTQRHVLLHGDCHPNNALLSGNQVSLIDLDQAGIGDPAADVGSLLARVHRDAVLGEISAGDDYFTDQRHGDRTEAAFSRGYNQTAAPLSNESIAWHTAAAILVEQSVRAVNRIRPRTIERLEPLLARAQHLADAAKSSNPTLVRKLPS